MDQKPADEDVTLHSIPDVAERLRISERSVYYLLKAGQLRRVTLGTTKRPKTRIRSDDLAAYIESKTLPPDPVRMAS